MPAQWLIDRYNVALAQAVLLALGAGQGRGQKRAARAVSPALPAAQVSPSALPGRGEHARWLCLPNRRPAEPLQLRLPSTACRSQTFCRRFCIARTSGSKPSCAGARSASRAASCSSRATAWYRTRPIPARTRRPSSRRSSSGFARSRRRWEISEQHRSNRAGPRGRLGSRLSARPRGDRDRRVSRGRRDSGSGRAWSG